MSTVGILQYAREMPVRKGKQAGVSVSWDDAMIALEWVRLRLMNRGSPDFLRQAQAEARVQALCAQLARSSNAGIARSPDLTHRGAEKQITRHVTARASAALIDCAPD